MPCLHGEVKGILGLKNLVVNWGCELTPCCTAPTAVPLFGGLSCLAVKWTQSLPSPSHEKGRKVEGVSYKGQKAWKSEGKDTALHSSDPCTTAPSGLGEQRGTLRCDMF